MPPPKVDNSHHALKRDLRLRALGLTDHTPVRVLDAYAGLGALWRDVRSRTDLTVTVVGVDKRSDAPREMIRADNRKVLRSLDLTRFDLIDLDAYGIPAEQLAIVAERAPDVPVIVTCIADARGGPPHDLCRRLGIPVEWVRTAPRAVARLGWARLWEGYCHRLGYRRRIGHVVQDSTLKRYEILTR